MELLKKNVHRRVLVVHLPVDCERVLHQIGDRND
jgi:hypothetical protein